MSDSDEWASASDSELQDNELQPVRTTKLADIADKLTLSDETTSVNKSSSINTADNNTQERSVKLSPKGVKLEDIDTLPSQEPPPYEYVCIYSTSSLSLIL